MLYHLLADAVVVLHLAFVAFVVLGGFVALRFRRAWLPHAAAVAYGAGIVAIGWSCPLTSVENDLRAAGGASDRRGFVETYLEGVLYPGHLTSVVRALAAVAIAGSWAVLLRRHQRLVRAT